MSNLGMKPFDFALVSGFVELGFDSGDFLLCGRGGFITMFHHRLHSPNFSKPKTSIFPKCIAKRAKLGGGNSNNFYFHRYLGK